MEEMEIKVGDWVKCLYKLLDNAGQIFDVQWVYGKVLSVEHEFSNKYPYEVKFKHNDIWKTSLFEASEVRFFVRESSEGGARTIPIKEEKYITWPEEWIDDYQP